MKSSCENLKYLTEDCLSTINNTNLNQITEKKYKNVPIKEFDNGEIETAVRPGGRKQDFYLHNEIRPQDLTTNGWSPTALIQLTEN